MRFPAEELPAKPTTSKLANAGPTHFFWPPFAGRWEYRHVLSGDVCMSPIMAGLSDSMAGAKYTWARPDG
ncbi:MAG: hypothetical protein ABIL62_08095 [Planctomycetota bacterium]